MEIGKVKRRHAKAPLFWPLQFGLQCHSFRCWGAKDLRSRTASYIGSIEGQFTYASSQGTPSISQLQRSHPIRVRKPLSSHKQSAAAKEPAAWQAQTANGRWCHPSGGQDWEDAHINRKKHIETPRNTLKKAHRNSETFRAEHLGPKCGSVRPQLSQAS